MQQIMKIILYDNFQFVEQAQGALLYGISPVSALFSQDAEGNLSTRIYCLKYRAITIQTAMAAAKGIAAKNAVQTGAL